MKFIPFDSISLRTKLKAEEVQKRLNLNVSTTGFFESDKDYGKPFKGRIEGNTFVIKRKMISRNSFRPVLSGMIEDTLIETVIHVKMRLTIYAMVFMIVWLGIMGFITGAFSFVPFSGHGSVDFFAFLPWVILVFVYLITMIGFNVERQKAITALKAIFEAEISE
jgi:hypothetical protein